MKVASIQLPSETKIRKVDEMAKRNGFTSYPVVNNKELVGIITSRDIFFITDLDQTVTAVITTKPNLIKVKECESHDVVFKKLPENSIEKILVVYNKCHLFGMITVKNFKKAELNSDLCWCE
ncbi:CBS domain-containing protein [Arsenophonus endosymbiont of Aleurodicus dispersus]|uniref:CBS domain-containing protein n=1 Tax=Arsenophonus endosymbiont of Aleurodicus dispersus TaxID=235559 RepID=UPI001F53FD29|nr:CBS domain-containing protein [Arsenophonus endosymbiont of Aleurodicus dispersus]